MFVVLGLSERAELWRGKCFQGSLCLLPDKTNEGRREEEKEKKSFNQCGKLGLKCESMALLKGQSI